MNIAVSKMLESATGEMQDLLEIRPFEQHALLAVADGAGGLGGGRASAEFLMKGLLNTTTVHNSLEWAALLEEIDQQMNQDADCGETTGAVAMLSRKGIIGASVGDSEIWVFTDSQTIALTERQKRKPLIGSGEAIPVGFEFSGLPSAILIATDGLFKYTSRERIESVVRTIPEDLAASRLIDLVRLNSGSLQDDIAVGICRLKYDSSL